MTAAGRLELMCVTGKSREPGDIISEQRTPFYGGLSENDLVERPASDLFHALGGGPSVSLANSTPDHRHDTAERCDRSARRVYGLPNRGRSGKARAP